MKRADGFTLAEVLAVLAILAMLALAIWPNLSGGKRSDLAQAETTILNALRMAQAKAIGENRETRVEIDVNARLVNNEVLPSQLAIKVLAGGHTENAEVAVFRFFPDGTSTGGEVEIRSTSASRLIAVNWLTGSVRPVIQP
jgi:general secretion pathway protein H